MVCKQIHKQKKTHKHTNTQTNKHTNTHTHTNKHTHKKTHKQKANKHTWHLVSVMRAVSSSWLSSSSGNLCTHCSALTNSASVSPWGKDGTLSPSPSQSFSIIRTNTNFRNFQLFASKADLGMSLHTSENTCKWFIIIVCGSQRSRNYASVMLRVLGRCHIWLIVD